MKHDPTAYTMKIRGGKPGGGKGPLIQKDKSATLACNNDQIVFVPRNLCLNDQGGSVMSVTYGKAATLRAEVGGYKPMVLDKKRK